MKTIFLSFCATIMAFALQAQQVKVKVSENGTPMAYHNVTVSQNGEQIGSGQTDSDGYAEIEVSQLLGRAVDVEGKYQNGGTKREWSIKGKLKLDGRNFVEIKLEDMAPKFDNKLSDKFKNDGNLGGGFGNNDEPEVNENAEPISKKDFQSKLKEISNTMSSFDKADKAKAIAAGYKLTSAQVKQLISSLSSSFTQKDVAILAYANCTDPENYKQVTAVFTSSMMRKEVEDATINK